jgi:hypothetical protein
MIPKTLLTFIRLFRVLFANKLPAIAGNKIFSKCPVCALAANRSAIIA